MATRSGSATNRPPAATQGKGKQEAAERIDAGRRNNCRGALSRGKRIPMSLRRQANDSFCKRRSESLGQGAQKSDGAFEQRSTTFLQAPGKIISAGGIAEGLQCTHLRGAGYRAHEPRGAAFTRGWRVAWALPPRNSEQVPSAREMAAADEAADPEAEDTAEAEDTPEEAGPRREAEPGEEAKAQARSGRGVEEARQQRVQGQRLRHGHRALHAGHRPQPPQRLLLCQPCGSPPDAGQLAAVHR
mmetsp:Transcript_86130/g.143330  ORF Transcript_86130/g.143330 Transcript_86130/m.143330 type:complete len:244 (-) Transcript_86130:1025-1756(-)